MNLKFDDNLIIRKYLYYYHYTLKIFEYNGGKIITQLFSF